MLTRRAGSRDVIVRGVCSSEPTVLILVAGIFAFVVFALAILCFIEPCMSEGQLECHPDCLPPQQRRTPGLLRVC